MGKLLCFPGETTTEVLLEKAKEWGLKTCLIIGEDENDEFVMGGTIVDIPFNVFILEKAKKRLMEEADLEKE